MGNFETLGSHVPQSVDCDFYLFTDNNFPRRHCSMTPRLQARIPKMFGWQMVPGYDFYIWIDGSFILSHTDSVRWLTDQGDGFDMVLFAHPNRQTIEQEADHIKSRLAAGCPYITPRYENELVDEQLAVIREDKDYTDHRLYASSVVPYHNTDRVRDMMVQWWYHTSRFHSVDQLSLPYVIYKSRLSVNVIPVTEWGTVVKSPYVRNIRGQSHAS
jgi:hypothetical protein